jgi:Mrp family chromosome partitioning ATPase/capsular polysaccharide biosynthesis protein
LTEAFDGRPTSVADYLAILRRRKWIVAIPPVIAAVLAFVVSSTHSPVYRAEAQILVDRTNLLSTITQVGDPSLGDPTRFLNTQADIARSPELAGRVGAELGMSAGRVLAETNVTPSADADVLSVAAEDGSSGTAVRLANTFARQFTDFTRDRSTARIDDALVSLRARLKSLAAHGQAGSPEYDQLAQQQSQLEVLGKLLAGNTIVLQRADNAGKVRPRPKRQALLAGLLGLVLGLALAFLAEALDRHVRSEHELDDALDLPLLARIPKPPRKLQKANELVMLKEPGSVQAETFRKLRTSFEFVNPDGGARTIMVTSAVAKEGKSTTVANLAVALARAGRKVLLVDLDLRAPFLSRLFHVGGRPGITDVALKRAPLEQALRPIALVPMRSSVDQLIKENGASPSNGNAPLEGLLHLLPAGSLPPSADEMLEDPRLIAVLDKVAEQFEIVLIDAPPLLAFGDAMILSGHVDALFAVARLGRVQRPILHEFARQLRACRAKPLGYVVTGVEHSESYRYMYEGYAYDPRLRERIVNEQREHV